MPTYNQAPFIGQAIASLRRQTYPDWEAVIVDDGSDDATLPCAATAIAGDPRIRVVVLAHRGPFALAESYNRGLKDASGRLIGILEGDDLWPPDKLECQLALHEDREVVFSYGSSWTVDRWGDPVRLMKGPPSVGTVPAAAVFREALFRRAGVMPVSVLIDRRALMDAGGFHTTEDLGGDPLPTADFPTFLNLLRRGGWVARTDRILGYWRDHPGQTTDRFRSVFPQGMYRLARHVLSEAGATPTDFAALARAYRPLVAGQHLADLRHALVARDRRQALTAGLSLFADGSPLRRVEAVAGILHACLGLSMEWPFAAASALGWRGMPGADTDPDTVVTAAARRRRDGA